MSGLYLGFVLWNLSIGFFFIDYLFWLTLPIYIAGNSIEFHMESALGPESICMFPYGITPFQIYSYTDLINLVSIFFMESCCHMDSIWKHLKSSGPIFEWFRGHWGQRLFLVFCIVHYTHCSGLCHERINLYMRWLCILLGTSWFVGFGGWVCSQ